MDKNRSFSTMLLFKQATLAILNIFSAQPKLNRKKIFILCRLQLRVRSESQKNTSKYVQLGKMGEDESKSGSKVVNENVKRYL